jgi:hexosaminidase
LNTNIDKVHFRNIITPQPFSLTLRASNFTINEETLVLTDEYTRSTSQFLTDFLRSTTDLNLKLEELNEYSSIENCIMLKLNSRFHRNNEAYNLEITKDKIFITGPTNRGLFYGIQSLIQLIQRDIYYSNGEKNQVRIDCVEIEDFPRFEWRGFMLDEARHFFGKEIVKKILNIMAMLKFNTFHWHLTDDQGWRIEIKKYPLLTEIGSRREGTAIFTRKGVLKSELERNQIDGKQIIGYYTQEELKEIINYAAERYITIIPEIDMPGHTTALLAAYPNLSCTGGPFNVGTKFGIYKDILCVGKEKVFNFIENILEEIIELFPSDFIHIGGDEVPKSRWKKCVDCQKRMKSEGIKNTEDLQVYFTNRIAKFLLSHEKKVVSWNDTIHGNLKKEIYCQYWNAHFDKVLNDLKEGRKVIISEVDPTYLNYPYLSNSLQNTYQYDPIPKELEEKYNDSFIGIEACMWTERIKTQKKLEWLLYPRLIAIAEIGWSQKNNKDYSSFKKRLKLFKNTLNGYDINYALKEEYEGQPTNTSKHYFETI